VLKPFLPPVLPAVTVILLNMGVRMYSCTVGKRDWKRVGKFWKKWS